MRGIGARHNGNTKGKVGTRSTGSMEQAKQGARGGARCGGTFRVPKMERPGSTRTTM